GHTHARLDDAIISRVADGCLAQQSCQLADAGLDLALLFFRGVVPAVLLQVALITRGLDAFRDLIAATTTEVVKFCGETVVRLLGQPGDGLVVSHCALLVFRTLMFRGWNQA